MEVFLSLNLLMMLCNVDYEICKHFARTSNQLDPLLKPIFSFCPLNEAEVSILLLSSHPTTCLLDLIPSHLLQAISPSLLPALTHIINTYLLTGIFPTAFKQARITPLLKKPTLNTSLIENYRPVSLSFHSLPKHSNKLSSTRSHCFFHRTINWTLNSQVSGVVIQLRLRYSRSLKPCELQKPIPNHQSSFCWICLPLLTLSIIRSSCPPFHHWTSLGFHFAGLNHISLVGLSGWHGEGRYPKHINWLLGFPRDWFLDPLLLSTYTTSLDPIIQAHGFSYHFYADDTQLYLSFRPDDPKVAARISGCLADISAWMKEHHLQLNQAKTELIVFPANPTLQHDFTIQLGSSTITPSA